MGEEGKRCGHSRLVRIEFAAAPVPMFGNVFKCEECSALVEVVIGRTITTQQLREFADAIDSGRAKPSLPPPPKSTIDIDENDIVAVAIGDDAWSDDGNG
jgi:hypothetical protein